ncbi:hypothetical protein CFELI_03325 [Corynebacterium felinum]|nr:hypothetical protein CFELI_03325 [Corynebacterium felinum]
MLSVEFDKADDGRIDAGEDFLCCGDVDACDATEVEGRSCFGVESGDFAVPEECECVGCFWGEATLPVVAVGCDVVRSGGSLYADEGVVDCCVEEFAAGVRGLEQGCAVGVDKRVPVFVKDVAVHGFSGL